MGVYYIVANLDKKEYIHGHELGTGAKFFELPYRVMPALACLLNGRWKGDRIAIYNDSGEVDQYDRIRYNHDGEPGYPFTSASGEALALFREEFLGGGDPRLSPWADEDSRERGHGPWFRFWDPDKKNEAPTEPTSVEVWMRGFLTMHDPEDIEREIGRQEGRAIAWLREQGNRYEGLSAREVLAQVVADLEAGEHKKGTP